MASELKLPAPGETGQKLSSHTLKKKITKTTIQVATMTLLALGISHKTAPISIREKFAFNADELPSALASLRDFEGISESLLVSTCNRTELYCNVLNAQTDLPLKWLNTYSNDLETVIDEHLYCFSEEQAVQHILRVTSGLDSMILGEPQILGQVKQAYREAVDAGTIGKLFNRLMQFSFSTAKMIRSKTEIGQSPVTVALAAVKLAQQIHGELEEKTAVLIGAGETIELVASYLSANHIGKIIISNRSLENAKALAGRFRAEATGLKNLRNSLEKADIVVASTASKEPIVTKEDVAASAKKRTGRPIFIVDLAVPRDVEASVGKLDNTFLYTIDDLERVVLSNLKIRKEAATSAEEMILEQVLLYMDWMQSQANGAVINALRKRGEEMRQKEIAKALNKIELGHDPRDIVEELATKLTKKLLHHPTTGLRNACENDYEIGLASKLLGLNIKNSD